MANAKIISISNHKGGTGKTTTAVNVGASLALRGYRVLLVDLDAQANLTQSLGFTGCEAGNVYAALIEQLKDRKTTPAVTPQRVTDNLDIITTSRDLAALELTISSQPRREHFVTALLHPVTAAYDYIILDTPPGVGMLTINALAAAHFAIIPLQADFLSLRGLASIVEIINTTHKQLNTALHVAGVVVTHYDSRKTLNRNVLESVTAFFDGRAAISTIRENVSIAEAAAESLDVFRYAPNSNGAADYSAFTDELLKYL